MPIIFWIGAGIAAASLGVGGAYAMNKIAVGGSEAAEKIGRAAGFAIIAGTGIFVIAYANKK